MERTGPVFQPVSIPRGVVDTWGQTHCADERLTIVVSNLTIQDKSIKFNDNVYSQ
jgi:hypothetical protein